jgi:lysophospholipase
VPGNDLPEGIAPGVLITPDGVKLRYAISPAGGQCRGTVCLLEGRGDFIERYFETIDDLKARGFAVAILDWRGQGGSQRPLRNPHRGYVRNFRQYDIDLAAFMKDVVLPDCPPPYFAIAHSTGANVLLRALKSHNWFERVVLSAPLIDIAPARAPKPLIRFVAWAMVLIGLGWVFVPGMARRPFVPEDFDGSVCTTDRRRFLRDCRTLEAAPHLGLGGATFGWLHAALTAIGELRRFRSGTHLRVPALIVAAGDDRLVSTEAALQFARRVRGVAAVVIRGSRHEPLMERDAFREQFWAAFDSFIGEAAPAAHLSGTRALA